MPNKAFDDVGFVAQHRRAEEPSLPSAPRELRLSAREVHYRRSRRGSARRQSAPLRRWRAMRDTAKAAEARRAHLSIAPQAQERPHDLEHRDKAPLRDVR